MTDATCPQCKGSKEPSVVFINRGENGCSVERRPCSRCNGKGTITAYEHGLCFEGLRVRNARVAADLSLWDAATLFGCSTPELSDIEHGRAPAHHDILISKIAEHVRERASKLKVVKRGGPFSDEPHPWKR